MSSFYSDISTINRTQEGTSHKFTYTRSVLESVASSSEAVG